MYRINKDLCLFSPTGEFFATAYQQELTIRDSKTLDEYQSFSFSDTIEDLLWSPNGQLILCANSKKNIIEIYSLKLPNWNCKLTEGSAGFENIKWISNSKEFILTSDFNVHLSVYNIQTRKNTQIWGIKSSIKNNYIINNMNEKLAVIKSSDGKDFVELYEIKTWQLTQKLVCDKLFGIDGISWSPNGELLAIWCSTIGKSRLLIYSTITNSHIGAFSSENNEKNKSDELYYDDKKNIKGIDKIVWGSTGELIAIAGYNEKIAIVNYITWSVVLEFYCGPIITEDNILSKIFKEVDIKPRNWTNDELLSTIPDHPLRFKLQEIYERPVSLSIDLKPCSYNVSIATIDILEFNTSGKYLAIRHQLYPTVMFIWDLLEDTVDYVFTKNPISGICWKPNSKCLFIFSNSSVVIEWKPDQEATCFETPKSIKVLNASCNPVGDTLALHGYCKTSIIRIND